LRIGFGIKRASGFKVESPQLHRLTHPFDRCQAIPFQPRIRRELCLVQSSKLMLVGHGAPRIKSSRIGCCVSGAEFQDCSRTGLIAKAWPFPAETQFGLETGHVALPPPPRACEPPADPSPRPPRGLPARQEPRPPRGNQRGPVRCPQLQDNTRWPPPTARLWRPLQVVPFVVNMLVQTAHFILR